MLNVLTCHHGHQTGLVDVCEGSQLSHCQDGLHMGRLHRPLWTAGSHRRELRRQKLTLIQLYVQKYHTRTKENHADAWGQCQVPSLKETSVNQEQQACLRGFFWYLNPLACWLHTPVHCPVSAKVRFMTISISVAPSSTGHLYLLKTGLQWCLSSRETSSHWSKRTRKREREVRQCSCTLSGKMFEEGMKRVLR